MFTLLIEFRRLDFMAKLSLEKCLQALTELEGWELISTESVPKIKKAFLFNTYLGGISFTQKVALKSEELDHHPDILVQWGKILVTVFTHSESGLTLKDFNLAKEIDCLK